MSVLAPIKRFIDEVIYLLILTVLIYVMRYIFWPHLYVIRYTMGHHIPAIITFVAALFITIIIKFYIEVW